jgi:hypothetical protein
MIFIRNVRTPTIAAARSAHATILLLREVLKLGGWTDQLISKGPTAGDADPAWAASLVLSAPSPTGLSVLAANPLVINDPDVTGRFTSAMVDQTIILNGTSNKGMFRISQFVDAHNVIIDQWTAPPGGWVNESDIPSRVVDVTKTIMTAGGTFLSQAPAGNNQARSNYVSTSSLLCYTRPKGGAALATEVPSAGIGVANATDTWLRLHAVLDGRNAFIWWTSAFGFRFVLWGELDAVDTGDSNPGFIWSLSNPGSHVAVYTGYMLNHLDAQVSAYPTFMKSFTGDDYTAAFYLKEFRRLQNGIPGKLALRVPKVCLDNISGCAGYRGKLPIIRFTNYYMESYRPLDASGNWLFLYHGLVSPRNGPNDPLPILGG